MGWIACVRCKKFRCELVAQTSALIAPVQPISHQVSCSNETIQNAHKHYKTHQFMSLAPMGWIRCVHCEKLWCDFVARSYSLIAPVQPVLHRVSCSNKTNPKYTQTVRNEPILEFRVQWVGSGVFVAKKFQCDLVAQTCPIIAPSST
jgi:hypothetical protein